MSDVTDSLRVMFARPSNDRDVFVKRQALIENNTQHLHVLSHRKIRIGDGDIQADLRGGYNYDSTAIQPPFDSHSSSPAIRPRYDHSTTYVTNCVCGRAVLRPK